LLEAPSWHSAATGAVVKSARGVRRACTLASKRCEDACDSGPRGQGVPNVGKASAGLTDGLAGDTRTAIWFRIGQGRLAEIQKDGTRLPSIRSQLPDTRCAVARCRVSEPRNDLPRARRTENSTERDQLAKETSVDRCGNTLQWRRRTGEAMVAGLKTIHRQLTTPKPSWRTPDTNFR
jgi:hypothetical protein